MDSILSTLRLELKENIDPKTQESGQHFFKEKVNTYGIKTADVTAISKKYFKSIQGKTKAEIFALCDELWQSGIMEESFIACNWSYQLRKQFEPADFQFFKRWIQKYVSNWAACDTFCNHTVGEFVGMFPVFLNELKAFAKSENRWERRAAAVSLIIPARKGKFLRDILEIADLLLLDADDLVQKGYGWMLKAASQAHQTEIFDFVMSKKTVMPRTALRYAIEKMPQELKTRAMEK
jgi:3-methyladenine DNA glycosylase AlkD